MTNYFLQTLQHLRQKEEVMLYENLLEFSTEQQEEAVKYLAEEYHLESYNYPGLAPAFDPSAALWAGKTIYIAAQLILYRATTHNDLETLLPAYREQVTPSAFLSTDLVLRFVPDIIRQLKVLDPSDAVIKILQDFLKVWHYSAVNYSLPVEELNFDAVIADPSLHQLYIDRVIQNKATNLANHPALINGVKATLGIHTSVFWNGFKEQGIINYEQH